MLQLSQFYALTLMYYQVGLCKVLLYLAEMMKKYLTYNYVRGSYKSFQISVLFI